MAISYAYVRYLKDQEKEIVHIRDIKKFRPQHVRDFIENKAYMVRWKFDESDTDQTNSESDDRKRETGSGTSKEWYKAQILLLGETYEEVERKIDTERVRISKVLDTSVESSGEEEEEQTQEEGQKEESSLSLSHLSKQRKKKKHAEDKVKQKALKEVLEEKLRQRKRSLPFAVEESGKRSKKSTASENSGVPALQTKVAELEKANAALHKENEEYRLLNRKLQRTLLEKTFPRESNGNVHGTSPNMKESKAKQHSVQSPKEVTSSSHQETEMENSPDPAEDTSASYQEVGDKVQLGNNVSISTSAWKMLKVQKRNSLFVKNLAVAVWGSNVLKDKSVDGKVCPRFKEKAPRPPLTPEKLAVVKRCFENHVTGQGMPPEQFVEETQKFKKYITEKIMDINRLERKRNAAEGV